MKRCRGGITVFLAVIFMAMLVMTGSLVDIARIMVAGRKLEASLSASARSVLAGYDEALVGEFGLYGLVDTTAMEKELLHYLNLNLEERHQGINFINYEVQQHNTSVEAFGSLTNREVLKRQILEYMKYRAPISITQSLIEQLRKAKLGQKTEFAGKESKVRGNAKELEKKIEELNDEVEAVNSLLDNLAEQELDELQSSLKRILDVQIPEIRKLYDSYTAARTDSDDFLDQQDPEDNLSNRQAGINGDEADEFESVLEDCEAISSEAAEINHKVDQAVLNIKPIRKVINSLDAKIDSLQRSLKALKKKQNPPANLIREYEHRIKELQEQVDEKEENIEDIVNDLQRELGRKKVQKIDLDGEDEELPEHSNDNTGDFMDKIDEIQDGFSKLSVNIGQELLITQSELDASIANDNKYFAEMQNSLELGDKTDDEECESSFNKIFQLLSNLSRLISSGADGLRDKLYITEYVMDKFTFLTSQTERNHLFCKGEVEYILNGMDIPYDAGRNYQSAVIVNVVSEMWFLRFSIDAIDAFATSKIAHPPARLAWALTEGAIAASTEMVSMLRGDGIKICPSFKNGPELRYSDHLRILLLLQDEDETLRKIQQLAQVDIRSQSGNSGSNNDDEFRLSTCKTIVKAEAEVSINLWFLPLLKLDKLGLEGFEEGSYNIRREVTIGY